MYIEKENTLPTCCSVVVTSIEDFPAQVTFPVILISTSGTISACFSKKWFYVKIIWKHEIKTSVYPLSIKYGSFMKDCLHPFLLMLFTSQQTWYNIFPLYLWTFFLSSNFAMLLINCKVKEYVLYVHNYLNSYEFIKRDQKTMKQSSHEHLFHSAHDLPILSTRAVTMDIPAFLDLSTTVCL